MAVETVATVDAGKRVAVGVAVVITGTDVAVGTGNGVVVGARAETAIGVADGGSATMAVTVGVAASPPIAPA